MYVIRQKMLGRGVFGSVRLIKKYGIQSAVKESHFKSFPEDKDIVMACLREEQFNLQHPHIIKRYWTRWNPGRFQVCMEVGTPVKRESAARILHDITQALFFMHHHGFIHRDVKPENIVRVGNHYKLIDFGLTRKETGNDMITGYTITRWFRPPELLRAGDEDMQYDGRVDMYSLALTAYMIENDKPLFYGESKAILRMYEQYTPTGIYAKLICDYDERYTAKQLLDFCGVDPIYGTVTKVVQRDGVLNKFVEYMVDGHDWEAATIGYKEIYNEL